MQALTSVCIFCGSRPGRDPAYLDAARAVGALLGSSGVDLVYGGGSVGLMGAVADAALAAGGRVIGVIPQVLVDMEQAHPGLTELHVVGSMHERKRMMADLASAFVALPGGLGTFEELCEILTWAMLGIHRKPCAVLDVGGYYQPLLALLDHAVGQGFLRPAQRALLTSTDDPRDLLPALQRQTAARHATCAAADNA